MRLLRRGRDPELGTEAEVRGVGAGSFSAPLWETGNLYFVRDSSAPLLAPRPGAYRNIYAPSVIREKNQWRVFYGAWDGIPTGNDCLYQTTTKDFRAFTNRQMVVEHGSFVHVCNVSATRLRDGSYRLLATAYPDTKGLNKPITFVLGKERVRATPQDLITLDGDSAFPDADCNGMNVVFQENGRFSLYYGDFKRFGTTWRATSSDGKHFTRDSVALTFPGMVNDVRKLGKTYLMALHANSDRLWYSLSRDCQTFASPRVLLTSATPEERYIVAVGMVEDGKRVLGVLYGAGPVPSLDRNAIFARWLQKKVTFGPTVADRAVGPERVRLSVPQDGLQGHFSIFAEDGKTLLLESEQIILRPGDIWELKQ